MRFLGMKRYCDFKFKGFRALKIRIFTFNFFYYQKAAILLVAVFINNDD